MREGARNIEAERHEAAREIRRCKTRECAYRESAEGKREVDRERREARYEVRQARDQGYWQPPPQYVRYTPNYGDPRYYGVKGGKAPYHSNARYLRDAR